MRLRLLFLCVSVERWTVRRLKEPFILWMVFALPVDRSQIKGWRWVFTLVLSSLVFELGELGWSSWLLTASYSYSLHRIGRRSLRLGKNHDLPTLLSVNFICM
ncbi:hypothetical protein M752DRAFT_67384 [Aspergillus phoenicis ATCC 13157]|uniref:Uncharacterized protein n=1 Tax=Aspergillus phoenicis ATCC 13157 TaxID=1353007 RepID=A0A370PXN6_ASPPH|nr:hypothetical protein M752DRAFT_67384 [Aspergillus phoenicis ATCC 13157]